MKSLKITSVFFGIIVLALLAVFLKPLDTAVGGAFPGTSVYLQSATTTSVGPQAVPAITLFSSVSDQSCKARVVSTRDTGVLISFGDTAGFGSTTLSATAGHWQAPSTTVVYDAEQFGCGRMSAFAGASTTLTLSHF